VIHHRIYWRRQSTAEIVQLRRAGDAFCFFRDERVSLETVRGAESNRNLTNGIEVPAGMIVDIEPGGLWIKTLDGCLGVTRFRCRGRDWSLRRWVKKFRPLTGESFA
jgi:methionyl-tRNA formyltransferase